MTSKDDLETSKKELGLYRNAKILYDKALKYGIRMDSSTDRWVDDPRYKVMSVATEPEEINDAMDYAKVRGELSDVPPPIIGIKSIRNPPYIYFVKPHLPRGEISPRYRKKKSAKPKKRVKK